MAERPGFRRSTEDGWSASGRHVEEILIRRRQDQDITVDAIALVDGEWTEADVVALEDSMGRWSVGQYRRYLHALQSIEQLRRQS